MECPSLWQSTPIFQSNLSLNLALNSTGSNDRVANVANSRTEDHDQELVVEVSSFKVCPACTANTDGTATPKINNVVNFQVQLLIIMNIMNNILYYEIILVVYLSLLRVVIYLLNLKL